MQMYETTQSADKYLNVALECSCGRTHYAPIKAVKICPGALNSLPGYVREYGYRRPYMICDPITYDIAGKRCAALLSAAGLTPAVHVIRHMGFDEATLGEIVINKPDGCDLMIGCGTGSVTDMLRYSSFKLGLPCFTVATAAPMDGFAASVGIMNVDGLKATMPAHCTEVIIGDTDILSAAPYRMTVAGFADLAGKLSSLNDWRLSALITGEHYCPKIDRLVSDYVHGILDETDALRRRESGAIGDVMNALLLAGTTASLYGSSRPISGAEHHMSHYWEVLGDQRGTPYAMHGEQVAVGTVMALMMSEELVRTDVDFDAARDRALRYDAEAWKREIERAYGSSADAVIRLEETAQKNAPSAVLKRIDAAQEHWDEVLGILENAFPSDRLIGIFTSLGCPCRPGDIGVSEQVLRDTFLYCKDTRDRYTLYQLVWDLGLTELLTGRIISRLEHM